MQLCVAAAAFKRLYSPGGAGAEAGAQEEDRRVLNALCFASEGPGVGGSSEEEEAEEGGEAIGSPYASRAGPAAHGAGVLQKLLLRGGKGMEGGGLVGYGIVSAEEAEAVKTDLARTRSESQFDPLLGKQV